MPFGPEAHRLPGAYAEAGSAFVPTRTPRSGRVDLGKEGLGVLPSGRVAGRMAVRLGRKAHVSSRQPAGESGRVKVAFR